MPVTENKGANIWKTAGPIFIASSLLLLSGFNSGYDYHLLQRLEKYPTFSHKSARSWIEYMTPLSMIPGGIIGGLLLDIFGRTIALIILALFNCFGWLVTAFAHNFHLLIIGRVSTSVISGAMIPASLVYITEISNPKHRSNFLTGPVVAFNLGSLIMHVVGEFESWKITSQVSAGLSILFTIFIMFLIETPPYLLSKGQLVLALDSFKWFHGETELEINELIESRDDITITLTFKDKLKLMDNLAFLERLGFISVLFIVVQFCGLNNFIFHADELLSKMFDDDILEIILILVVDSIVVIGSVIVPLFLLCFSKRQSFLSLSFATSMLLFCLAILKYFGSVQEVWLECILLIMYSISTSIITTLAWTFVGEVFSLDLRGLGSGLSCTIAYVLMLVSVRVTPDVIFMYGTSVWFALSGCLILICSAILCFNLPVTDGLTLLEIERNFDQITNVQTTHNTRL